MFRIRPTTKELFKEYCKFSTEKLREMVKQNPTILRQKDEDGFTLLMRMATLESYYMYGLVEETNKHYEANLNYLLSQNTNVDNISAAFECAFGKGTRPTTSFVAVKILLESNRIPEQQQRACFAKLVALLNEKNPNEPMVYLAEDKYSFQVNLMYDFLKNNSVLLNDLTIFNGGSLLAASLESFHSVAGNEVRTVHQSCLTYLVNKISTLPSLKLDVNNAEHSKILTQAFKSKDASGMTIVGAIIVSAFMRKNNIDFFYAVEKQDQNWIEYFLSQDGGKSLFKEAIEVENVKAVVIILKANPMLMNQFNSDESTNTLNLLLKNSQHQPFVTTDTLEKLFGKAFSPSSNSSPHLYQDTPHAGAIVATLNYILSREKNKNDYYARNCFTRFFHKHFAFSRTQKLAAARGFLEALITGNDSSLAIHAGALNQGVLGSIYKSYCAKIKNGAALRLH